MTLSSTEELCTGSTHDYNLNSDNNTPRKYSRSPPSSPGEVDEDVQEEIEELCDNVPDISEHFTVINKIGSGTFSSVYVAKLKNLPDVRQMFALKYLIPTSHPSRIENELKCLQQIGGHDHVMGVKACLRHRDHIVIVMPYFPHERFQDYVKNLSVCEVRCYMKALLVALKRVHSVNIIHRDVKPSNFLYNSKIKQYALVDFGLAQKATSTNEKPANSSANQSPDDRSKSENSKKSRRQSLEAEQRQVSNKRKHSNDSPLENSPKKKRIHTESHDQTHDLRDKSRKLAEIDMNVPHPIKNSDTKSAKQDVIKQPMKSSDTINVMTTKDPVISQQAHSISKSLFSAKDQPLSKALLRKRAIEAQQKTLEVGGIQLAAPGVGAEKVEKRLCAVVEKGGRQMYKSVAPATCDCYGKPQICTLCMARSSQHAPRAGTPGFRAPEVLLKCPDQTTAVDIWSAGVIFLSLLSGRYPFFKSSDDITALAQIVSLFGTETVRKASLAMGKNLLTNPEVAALDLKVVCEKLRGKSNDKSQTNSNKKCSRSVQEQVIGIPDTAYDLLYKLLDLNSATRITAEEALKHEYFMEKDTENKEN